MKGCKSLSTLVIYFYIYLCGFEIVGSTKMLKIEAIAHVMYKALIIF